MKKKCIVTMAYLCEDILFSFMLHSIKGELQCQNKLISCERPSKILQNETKTIKIDQAVLQIFDCKDQNLDNFTRKNDRKTENVVFLEVLHKLNNNRLCDVNKQSRIFLSVDLIRT